MMNSAEKIQVNSEFWIKSKVEIKDINLEGKICLFVCAAELLTLGCS